MIFFTLKKIYALTGLSDFKLSIHHSFVFCENNTAATNSPEDIYQDEMDFIILAFVVERKNIKGAKSIIYKQDKKTRFLKLF